MDAYILKPKLFSSALAIPVAAIVSFAYHEYFMKSDRRPDRKARSENSE